MLCLSGWVAEVVSGLLSEYLDVRPEDLRISLLRGKLSLHDVSIRNTVLDQFLMPVTISQARIKSVELSVPWTKFLYSSA